MAGPVPEVVLILHDFAFARDLKHLHVISPLQMIFARDFVNLWIIWLTKFEIIMLDWIDLFFSSRRQFKFGLGPELKCVSCYSPGEQKLYRCLLDSTYVEKGQCLKVFCSVISTI